MRNMVLLLLVILLSAIVTAEQLTITSEPSGASVYVSNSLRGTTPVTIDVAKGKHGVKMTMSGYRDEVRTAVVEGDTIINVLLSSISKDRAHTSSIRVESNPQAYLYLDNVLQGMTPKVLTKLEIGKQYTIKLVKKGYVDYVVKQAPTASIVKVVANLIPIAGPKAVAPQPKVTKSIGKVKPMEATTDEIAYGTFAVSSTPSGADVYIDGQLVGQSPTTTQVTAIPSHEIKLVKNGYHPYTIFRSVDPEDTETITATLLSRQIKANTGSIYVTSAPASAAVYVDDVYHGRTPLTVKGIAAGEHRVKLALDGFKDYISSKKITMGRTLNVGTSLVRQPQTDSGTIAVTAVQREATVYVDDMLKGMTPVRVSVKAGQHTVKVAKGGFVEYSALVNVNPNRVSNVFALLKPAAAAGAKGIIDVKSVPLQAEVMIDGEAKGTAPVAASVPIGLHDVRVTKQGYGDYTTTVMVADTKTTHVWAALKKNRQ
ncbi:PEGA domain-containing protein [Candidatus Woesearchaeota archaeon]|nr:PEGA domain-containing protein [Candidatus Woesearchaeota archaeon]